MVLDALVKRHKYMQMVSSYMGYYSKNIVKHLKLINIIVFVQIISLCL